jgi:multiple sugar transport system substrate-binding protein
MTRQRTTALIFAATALIAVAVAAGLLTAGCGSKQQAAATSTTGGGETILVWHGYTDVEKATVEQAVAEFNATNPGFTVKAVYAGNNDYAQQKLLTSITAGKFPDISYQYGSSMANLIRLPQIVNLNDMIKQPGVNWDDYFPAVRLAATVGNEVIGIPALVDNLALVYNKKLFDQAGVAYPTPDWTWTDFQSAAQKLTNTSTKQFGWAYVADGSEDTVWRFCALLWQAGGDLLTPDNTKAAFNSPAGLKAMTLLRDMAVTDKSVYLDSGNGNYLNLFNSGKIAMLWTGPWDLSSINAGVSYGVQILPADVTHATIAGPDNYVMLNNGAQNEADAWKFITWFNSAENHLKWCIQTGWLPLRQSETQLPDYKNVYLKKFPADELFVANLANVTKARPNIASYPEVSAALGQAVQAVLLGKAEPQAALSSAEQQVNGILATGGQ